MKSSFRKKTIKAKRYSPRKIKSFPRDSRRKRVKPKGKRSVATLLFKILFNKKVLSCFFIILLVLVASFLIFVSLLSRDLPNPDQLIDRDIAQSTTIYDRSGEHILYEFHGDEKRTLINLEDIPDHAKQATIAIEDRNFYQHSGFSVWAMIRTLGTNIMRGQRAGGSTLTQQFVKNALLSPEKKYSRKIKEILISQRIEKRFNKDEILQMYLNEIPYGSNAYGIEAASQKYFGKSARDLVLAESAVLAALPQAPSRYSPYGSNKELLIGRQQYILTLMERQGYITEEEREEALSYEVIFKGPETNIIAPHFVMYLREILAEKYGDQKLEQGGLKIYTTIDIEKQRIAEEAVKKQAEKNIENYNANNAAMVAIDPKTGQILAMVGSRDYFNQEIDGQVNVTTRLRQPGSSLKPLVYAALFEKGYTPNTILYDVLTNFSASGDPYEPRNYNLQEYGPISVREALAGSLNIPAVKAIHLAGINNVIDLAQRVGYTSLTEPERYGFSLVLGGAEIRLLEHTNAYGAFAREGEINSVTGILKITDREGKVLEEFKKKREKVLDPNIAKTINNILSDQGARSFTFGPSPNLSLGNRPSAVKTGTTNNFRDAWTIGYTPSLVAGVWVGNNDNSAMKRGADGSVIAAPIWKEFMEKALEGSPSEEFSAPEIKETGKEVIDGKLIGIDIKINIEDGSIATENTPEDLVKEVFIERHRPILYYVDKEDPLGPVPENPEKDPQFKLWEDAISVWLEKKEDEYDQSLLDQAEGIYDPENKPVFSIKNIENQEVIESGVLEVEVEATAPRGIHKVEYYINNNLLERKTSYPFNLNSDISFLSNGYYNFRILVCDDVLNCSEESMEINLLSSETGEQLPANLNIIYPGSGTVLGEIDFPLNIQMVSTNPEQITRIELKIKKDAEESFNIIRKITSVLDKSIEVSWLSPPEEKGIYYLEADFYNWNEIVKTSNRVTLNIN
jgi:1A family penicillin-binding protein